MEQGHPGASSMTRPQSVEAFLGSRLSLSMSPKAPVQATIYVRTAINSLMSSDARTRTKIGVDIYIAVDPTEETS